MKKRIGIILGVLALLLLVYFGTALLTRLSRTNADFVSVVVITDNGEDTLPEKLDSWIAGSLPYRFWQYLASPEAQRQAEKEAVESYEKEQGMIG